MAIQSFSFGLVSGAGALVVVEYRYVILSPSCICPEMEKFCVRVPCPNPCQARAQSEFELSYARPSLLLFASFRWFNSESVSCLVSCCWSNLWTSWAASVLSCLSYAS
jgi:hypothetical protein